jgi:hypothetical protein
LFGLNSVRNSFSSDVNAFILLSRSYRWKSAPAPDPNESQREGIGNTGRWYSGTSVHPATINIATTIGMVFQIRVAIIVVEPGFACVPAWERQDESIRFMKYPDSCIESGAATRNGTAKRYGIVRASRNCSDNFKISLRKRV